MGRLSEMEAFATVVEEGGFTDAARKLGISKSAVSKHISSLENRLGARLLSRTTRRINPTEIGLAYFDRANRILNDAGEADAMVATLHKTPAGALRISAQNDFGSRRVSPLLGRFMKAYPEVSVTLELSRNNPDLIAEGFDLAIRVGEQKDSSLRTRKLTETGMRLVASPGYLAKNPGPRTIDDLAQHSLLHYTDRAGQNAWHLRSPDGKQVLVRLGGGLRVNDGQSLTGAAVAGLGIAYLPDYLVNDALRSGSLVSVLGDLPTETLGVYAIFPPGRFTHPKVRAFIDYLVTVMSGH